VEEAADEDEEEQPGDELHDKASDKVSAGSNLVDTGKILPY
jgi:hypothetical protein